eukprot:13307405-Ditylum_brightwellii.AAC.2
MGFHVGQLQRSLETFHYFVGVTTDMIVTIAVRTQVIPKVGQSLPLHIRAGKAKLEEPLIVVYIFQIQQD